MLAIPSLGRRAVGFGLLAVLSAAGWVPEAAAAPALTRGPFLQQVTSQTAQVVWRTSTAAACTLTASGPIGPSFSIATPSGTEHVAMLAGLLPATHYTYTVRSGGVLAAGTDYFVQTAPNAGTGATTHFVIFGDSGTGSATQAAVAATLVTQNADFGIHVGDIIYPSGETQYYDPRYFQPYAPMVRHTPVFAILGNHDAGNTTSFFDAWHLPTNSIDGTERFYSFDFGDIHFVGLDTTKPLTAAILAWLAADLDASPRRWKMVFFHHTMYSCGLYHGTTQSLVNALAPVFEAHGVDVVFYGHDHHFERSFPIRAGTALQKELDPNFVNPGAPIYVISGAAGASRDAATDCFHTARAIATPSFARATVTADLFTMEDVSADGTVLDQMTLSKSGTPPPPPPAETVKVLSPNGSEVWLAGQAATLQWSASQSIAAVRIELSRGGAQGPWETLFASTPNDGAEPWTPTAPASSQCWLRVADASDGSPSDLSDAPFQITVAPPPPPPPPPGSTVLALINFQPTGVTVPAGYQVDDGAVFDATRGYGWTTAQTMRARALLPADPRDTFVDVTNTTTATWEMAFPNGTYYVAMLCGDAQTTASHRVALEGKTVILDSNTNANEFLQPFDIPVTVQDGRLTLTLGGSGALSHTKVNSIVIANGPVVPLPYTLSSPGTGDTRCIGTAVPIHWSGAGASLPMRAELSRAGLAGPWEPAVIIMTDDGQEPWTPVGAPSSCCAMRLLDSTGHLLGATPNPFALGAPSLELLAPNGGETWTVGTTQAFAWTSSCYSGNVRFEVSKTGPAGPWTTLISTTPNDGNETWIVRPEDAGSIYAQVIALPFGTPSDESDGAFSVITPPVAASQTWKFDFTVSGAAPATGFTADTGALFNSGLGYGWLQSVSMKQRNLLPGDCRDTFAQVTNNTSATWELAVPNGAYTVSLSCGDPLTSATHRVALEGHIVVADMFTSGGQYVTSADLPVVVADGRMSMTLGGSGQITSTKVGCIEIHSVGPPPAPVKHGPRREQLPVVSGVIMRTRMVAPAGPIRSEALFGIELAHEGHVRLALYDVRGRRVMSLYDGLLPAGRSDITWDTLDADKRHLGSGVYFVRFDTAGTKDAQRIVLIR